MSNTLCMTTIRPILTDKKIKDIQRLILENPDITRTQLSKDICVLWDWRAPSGQLKDISCRDMLRKLDKSGRISLPPAMTITRKKGQKAKFEHLCHDTSPIECQLGSLTPLEIEIVEGGVQLKEFKSCMDQFHYLGFHVTVGENMKYAVRSCSGEPLAFLLFGSAAWSCRDRDTYIGWDRDRRREALYLISNNQRFLVLPWVHVSGLASHTLSLVMKRISVDWEARYGHKLLAIETFVDSSRFRGSCYKAANFICVGRTTGRGRDGGHHYAILPEKDIYIYPLFKNYAEKLRGETL